MVRTSKEPYPCIVLGLTGEHGGTSFSIRYSVTLDGAESLSTSMMVLNTGAAELKFTGALHTYLACENVEAIKLQGLQGVTYEDNAEGKGGAKQPQDEPHLTMAGEVDRVYINNPAEAYIIDGARAVRVLKMGFPDAVVWNIGEAKSAGLKDMGAGEWRKYVCYEAAAIDKAVSVPANNSWAAGQTFTRLKSADVPAPVAPVAAAAAEGDDADAAATGAGKEAEKKAAAAAAAKEAEAAKAKEAKAAAEGGEEEDPAKKEAKEAKAAAKKAEKDAKKAKAAAKAAAATEKAK